VSRQSSVIASRAELEAEVARLDAELGTASPPLPADWGGYRVTPEVVEFWQGRPDRLHDRLVYRRGDAGWRVERLAP
jgi:pyridoxamine 5'-phosphate oxidase